ncbi:MAG: hypothetical protein K8U57_23990 [Planctomycetes bacterium]|nr:hypothetical protein [Planctomycetota bacterium]
MTLTPVTEWASATLSKIGNRTEENEDAVKGAADGLRFAIADGATEGWESGPWANHLAAAFIHCPPTPDAFPTWLAATRRTWAPPAPTGPVPWYAVAKQEEGSFSTVAGLEIRPTKTAPGWGWRAVAIGDSCILHIRGEELMAAFPLSSAIEFGNRPRLVPSVAKTDCPEPEWLAGRAASGDVFILASDAVAVRLFHPPTFKAALVAVHASLRTRDSEQLLALLRDIQTKINDDVSVIGIRLSSPQELP